MPDFRAFCRPASAAPAEIILSPEESHHLVSVNRACAGDPVIAFDGRGAEWVCELIEARKNAARLRVREARHYPPLPWQITLGQALPKGPGMDAIVRKATEIGAARIVPLASERSQVHLEGERSEKKTEKWQHAALEAAKQCGNPFVPEVAPLEPIADFIAGAAACDLRLIASLAPGAKSLQSVLAGFRAAHGRAPQTIAWLIGPEGDFSPAEMNLARAANFAPITLGPLVLRCETAAVYALSILSYELQHAAGGPDT
jgi:16S rRNA (uracil1498-N3)-methyltransferase